MSDIQLYIDPAGHLSKVPYKVPNNTHYVTLEDYEILKSDLQMEKDNEDRLVRMWQKANNEIYCLKGQVDALIDDQTRLKEKSKCQAECLDAFDKKLREAEAEVERLRKAGDVLSLALWLGVDEYSKQEKEKAEELWNAAKEGKPSV